MTWDAYIKTFAEALHGPSRLLTLLQQMALLHTKEPRGSSRSSCRKDRNSPVCSTVAVAAAWSDVTKKLPISINCKGV